MFSNYTTADVNLTAAIRNRIYFRRCARTWTWPRFRLAESFANCDHFPVPSTPAPPRLSEEIPAHVDTSLAISLGNITRIKIFHLLIDEVVTPRYSVPIIVLIDALRTNRLAAPLAPSAHGSGTTLQHALHFTGQKIVPALHSSTKCIVLGQHALFVALAYPVRMEA